jgi:hypothetical protein
LQQGFATWDDDTGNESRYHSSSLRASGLHATCFLIENQ